MHAIGADQRVAAYGFTILQLQRHTGGVLFEPYATRADMHCTGGALSERLDQRMMEIAAMSPAE